MTSSVDTRLPSPAQIGFFEKLCPANVSRHDWYRRHGFHTPAGNKTSSFNMTEMRATIARLTGSDLNSKPSTTTAPPAPVVATPPKLSDSDVVAMLVSMVDNYRVGLLTAEQVATIVRRTN